MGETSSIPLGEFCDQSRKLTYGIVQPGKLFDGGVPIVRVNNFRGFSLDLSERLHVAPAVEASYARSRPRAGDLLVSLVGSLGQAAIAPADIQGWNLARAVGLVPFDDIEKAQWAFYAIQLKSTQDFIGQRANTTVQATFNLKDLAQIPIPQPAEHTKNEALRVLRLLDDKIELNRRMNETLEEMARAVFRDWFVDFGPTRRQMQGATDPAAIMGHAFPPERATILAPMFPSTLGDNGLPEGWEKRQYQTLCKFVGGSAFKKEKQGRASGEIAFIKVSDMNLATNSRFIISANNYIDGSDQLRMKFKLHPKGSVVLAKIGIALTYNRLRILTDQTVIDNNMLSASPLQTGADTTFLFLSLSQIDFNLYAKGSALPYLNAGDLAKIDFTFPGERLKTEIENIAGPLLQKVLSNSEENQILANLRDLLLPKLMSGEIRLKNVEAKL